MLAAWAIVEVFFAVQVQPDRLITAAPDLVSNRTFVAHR